MNIKRTLFALLLCAIALPSAVGAQSLEPVSIQLKWFHQFQFAGYYAAKELGYFAEEGLDVELREYGEKGDAIKEVISGRADYGIADTGLLLSRLNGEPVTLVSQIFQHSSLILITMKDSGLRTPFDLADKRLMTRSQSTGDATLWAMVQKVLGSRDKVNWVRHRFNYQDLIDGKVDAMSAYSTDGPYWFLEQGKLVNLLDPRDYGIDFYGDNLFTTDQNLADHPEQVEKVRRAVLKGWKHALEQPDQIIDLILQKYNTQNKSRAYLAFEARQTAELIDLRNFDLGHYEATRFQKIAETYQRLGYTDQNSVPPGFYSDGPELLNEPSTTRISLTEEEKAWVKNNTVKVGIEQWPPFSFVDKAGEVQGQAGGFLRMVAKSTGLKFKIIPDKWDPLLKGLKNKTIDLLPVTYYTDERATYGLFSEPYSFVREFIYVKDGNAEIKSIDDLADKQIAVVKGYGTIPKIRAKYPKATIVETKDLMESIDAVLNGDVAALIEGQMVVEHTIKTNSIIGLRGISQKVFKASPIHFFSRIDEPLLWSILQKGLNAVSEEERRAEKEKWISSAETERDKLHLTPAELGWLYRHETMRLGIDTAWPPFEFLDEEGNHAGISSGYADAVSKRLGITLKVAQGLKWSDVIDKIKVGELDILSALARTPEREAFVNFTKPYIKAPIIIATHKDLSLISEISDLESKTVGVVPGYASTALLRANHPLLKLVEMPDVATLLQALSAGKIEAVVESLWVISYEKDRLGLDNIKVAAPTPYNYELSMAVRKDWPELVPILDKALSSLDKQETNAIKNTWTAVQVQFGLDMKTILTWAVPIGGSAILIILVIVVWNRKLGLEVEERKKAEQKLRESEEVAKAILNTSFQLQGLLKPNGDLIEANAAAMSMIDASKEDVVGVPFWDCPWWSHNPDIQASLRDGVKQTAQGESVKFQAEHHLPDGRIRIVDFRMSPVKDDDGEVVLIVPEGHDITELKEAEEKLRIARDAAEEATKAKATFLATMSHEIRTPMGGVIGMVDLLQQTKMTDDQRQMINTVGDSAHSLLTIINDILDFSKIEAGKLDLEEIPISIRDVVEGAGEALAVNARNKNIGLSVYVDPDIPDALVGDQVRIRQILFNFGSNAIKFTEKGKVLIRADKVPSRAKKQTTVRFQVIDEGIGIPEEAQKKLFQAFSQVDASTTRRFGGTGLGLTICQRLTEIMNGEIGVESVEGEGSTFSATITLPVAKEHTFKSDGHDLAGLNILFAHHDDDMRGLISRYLEHWKATVTTTAEIDKTKPMALAAAKKKAPFDVICVGSGWPIDKQIETVKLLQAEKKLSAARYVIACRGRVKAERKELNNTVYVDSGPVRRADFIRSIAVAAGRASPEVDYDDSEMTLDAGKAPTVAEAEAMGQLILLAEDNLTNQDVIRRQLTMLGYALEIANDGKEALELLETRNFAILLTDCHMPNMDGFELTKTIRASEKDKDVRFPIIAVTASVMKEEVDQCMAAGMDDCLAKPLEMKKLKEMFSKWMPVAEGVAAEAKTKSKTKAKAKAKAKKDLPAEDTTDEPEAKDGSDGGDGPIDPTALKSVFGDDEATFKEILNDFVEPATSNVEDIEISFTNRSADGVAKAAHKLKSSARSVGANELANMCQSLETAGKAEDWDEIDKSAPRLAVVMQEVTDYIKAL